MTPGAHAVLTCSLSLGVPLVLAIRELILQRRGDGDAWWRGDTRVPPPAPQPNGCEPAHRPLPDCLIPKPSPLAERAPRVRELA